MVEHIVIEVAYALPDKQRIVTLQVTSGTTALEAARQSGIDREFPGIDFTAAKMGVFGKEVKADSYQVKAGDRVEIYRPLLIDPKVSRAERAKKARAAKAAKSD